MTDPASIHERVFLVVVDDSPEMSVALRYASLRALHSKGRVALLHVIEPTDRQHWMALETLMREEKRQEAEVMLERFAAQVAETTGALPTIHIREGDPRDELLALINDDPSISILVLAAAVNDAGPGPLVTAVTNKLIGKLRVPVTIVPGTLTEVQIDALA